MSASEVVKVKSSMVDFQGSLCQATHNFRTHRFRKH